MKNLLPIVLLFFVNSALAQDLIVEYDMETQSYRIAGETKVKTGSLVRLKLVNLNTYLFKVKSRADYEQFELGQFSADDFSGFPLPISSSIGGGASPGLDLWFKALLSSADYSLEGSSKGETEFFEPALEEIQKSAMVLQDLEKELEETFSNLDALLTFNTSISLAKEEIRFLKRSLEISSVKEKAEKLSKTIFGAGIANIELKDLLKYRNIPRQVGKQITALQQKRAAFDQELRKIILNMAMISPSTVDQKTLQEVEQLIADGNKSLQSMDDNMQAIQQDTTRFQAPDLKDLVDIRDELRHIYANSFSYSRSFLADADEIVLHVQVSSDSLEGGSGAFQLPPLRIPTYGGLKINASIGLTLGQFFTPGERYYLKDSLIRASEGDNFIPSISTFVHFYPRRAGHFTIGGALGIGFPIAGSSDIDFSPSFFLGPTLLFGRSERLALSFGLQGGKVRRLSRGLQVGEAFDPGEGDIPTSSVYDLGYFLGLSFNVGRR